MRDSHHKSARCDGPEFRSQESADAAEKVDKVAQEEDGTAAEAGNAGFCSSFLAEEMECGDKLDWFHSPKERWGISSKRIMKTGWESN